tara:strand:- start:1691 stop:2125 length:435 start_codon:yes stop_codon:yes gene_type:complete
MTDLAHRTWHIVIRIAAVVGVLFGLMTLREGGAVLFVDGPARLAAGQYVPFVLWFNFIAGFFYVAAGLGLWRQNKWAARLAFAITAATLFVFAAFGWHVLSGGEYEMRTVVAMTLRSTIWLIISAIAWRALYRNETTVPMETKS